MKQFIKLNLAKIIIVWIEIDEQFGILVLKTMLYSSVSFKIKTRYGKENKIILKQKLKGYKLAKITMNGL